MSTYTVNHIMSFKSCGSYAPDIPHGIQDVIAAAYWAGESNARAQEREANRAAIASAPKSRYHKLVSRALALVNVSSVDGLRAECAELSGWTHELPTK